MRFLTLTAAALVFVLSGCGTSDAITGTVSNITLKPPIEGVPPLWVADLQLPDGTTRTFSLAGSEEDQQKAYDLIHEGDCITVDFDGYENASLEDITMKDQSECD